MHGEMLKARCARCDFVTDWHNDLTTNTPCPGCAAPGGMRPHVVWFGEMPLEMNRIATAIDACALFLSIGTSGNVYPAAGFVAQARRSGTRTVELNLEPSEGASLFDEAMYGPATEVVPRFVNSLLAVT
jgi:NAD-dependent deacetylase